MMELCDNELYDINGGGIVSGVGGAIIGGMIGNFVGLAGCATAYMVCVKNGENSRDAGKAALTTYCASVVTGACIGFAVAVPMPTI